MEGSRSEADQRSLDRIWLIIALAVTATLVAAVSGVVWRSPTRQRAPSPRRRSGSPPPSGVSPPVRCLEPLLCTGQEPVALRPEVVPLPVVGGSRRLCHSRLPERSAQEQLTGRSSAVGPIGR